MFKCHTNVCYDEYPEWAKRHKKFVLHNFILNKLAEISVWATHTNTNSEHPYGERVSRRECRECTNKNKFHPMRIGIRSCIHSNPGAKCELVNGFSLAIFFSSPLSLSLPLILRFGRLFSSFALSNVSLVYWSLLLEENRACLQVSVGIRYMIRCNVLAATFNDDK